MSFFTDVLRRNARTEFEQARYETDKLIIARMLFVGRDCLHQSKLKLESAADAMNDNIDRTRTR